MAGGPEFLTAPVRRKRPRLHHGKLYIDGALYQAWDVRLSNIHFCICVSPILNTYIALLLSFTLN